MGVCMEWECGHVDLGGWEGLVCKGWEYRGLGVGGQDRVWVVCDLSEII